MDITTRLQLDMKAVRRLIARALSLDEAIVLDTYSMEEVTRLNHFVTVSLLTSSDIGTEVTYNGDDEIETAETLQTVIISVNAYGGNSTALLSKLVASMRLSAMWQELKNINLGYLSASQVRNIPTVIGAGKEMRAQVDLTFSFTPIVQMAVNRGKTVKLNYEVIK